MGRDEAERRTASGARCGQDDGERPLGCAGGGGGETGRTGWQRCEPARPGRGVGAGAGLGETAGGEVRGAPRVERGRGSRTGGLGRGASKRRRRDNPPAPETGRRGRHSVSLDRRLPIYARCTEAPGRSPPRLMLVPKRLGMVNRRGSSPRGFSKSDARRPWNRGPGGTVWGRLAASGFATLQPPHGSRPTAAAPRQPPHGSRPTAAAGRSQRGASSRRG